MCSRRDQIREIVQKIVLHVVYRLLKTFLLFVSAQQYIQHASPQNGYGLLIILVVVIDNRGGLILLGGLHLAVLLGASRLL